MQTMSIGQLASAAGVGIDTVRFYERSGLLPPPARRPSGYRQYRRDDLRRLRFIRKAREIGFSLEEIAELLTLKAGKGRAAARARAIAAAKLEIVEQKIRELESLRATLNGLVAACSGRGDAEHCPILRAFEDEVVK